MTEVDNTLTLKYPEAKRYEGAPWMVFHGSIASIRDQVIAYFGFEQDQVAGLTMHELTLLAQQSIRGAGALAISLGATPVSQEKSWGNPQGAPESMVKGDGKAGGVWDQVHTGSAPSSKPAENQHGGLIKLLTEAESIDALKRLWATNKAAFEDKAVQEAYSARGKALKAAAG